MSIPLPLISVLVVFIPAHLAMSQILPIKAKVDAELGKPLQLCSTVPWSDTGIRIHKGQHYTITASASTDYKDSIIACDPDGPTGFFGRCFDFVARKPGRLNPLRWVSFLGAKKSLRVLNDGTADKRRASFLTLIACIGQDDRQANVITIGKGRSFAAHTDGTLYLFVNDWPGGPGCEGEDRFVKTDEKGRKTLPTYGNNKGYLTVTVNCHAP